MIVIVFVLVVVLVNVTVIIAWLGTLQRPAPPICGWYMALANHYPRMPRSTPLRAHTRASCTHGDSRGCAAAQASQTHGPNGSASGRPAERSWPHSRRTSASGHSQEQHPNTVKPLVAHARLMHVVHTAVGLACLRFMQGGGSRPIRPTMTCFNLRSTVRVPSHERLQRW